MKNELDEKKPWWHDSVLSFVKIASWIVGPILIGVVLGDFLDKTFKTSPYIEIILTGVLFIFSIYHMVKDAKKYEHELEEEVDVLKETK